MEKGYYIIDNAGPGPVLGIYYADDELSWQRWRIWWEGRWEPMGSQRNEVPRRIHEHYGESRFKRIKTLPKNLSNLLDFYKAIL